MDSGRVAAGSEAPMLLCCAAAEKTHRLTCLVISCVVVGMEFEIAIASGSVHVADGQFEKKLRKKVVFVK